MVGEPKEDAIWDNPASLTNKNEQHRFQKQFKCKDYLLCYYRTCFLSGSELFILQRNEENFQGEETYMISLYFYVYILYIYMQFYCFIGYEEIYAQMYKVKIVRLSHICYWDFNWVLW